MKKYKTFTSQSQRMFMIAAIVLLVAFLIWYYVGKDRNPYVLLFQLPMLLFVFLTQTKEVRLYDNDMIELRQYLKNKAFKPISVQQIVSYKQDDKNKNKLTIVYFRDQLRGSWTIRLSESDIADFTTELTRRNPAISKQ